MRVIAGSYKGRRLRAPRGLETRPILDRVKVALFDWLGARLAEPGRLPPIPVLDLFCGGGSLGIEALSRGAAFCAFVEADRPAFQCLRENLDRLNVGSAARIINGDVQSVHVAAPKAAPFGLVFLDPPYPLSEDVGPASIMGRVLDRLAGDIPVDPGGVVVWRHPANCVVPEVCARGWESSETRRWGTMAVTMFELPPKRSS
jgi:16S rRNA (guanine966-N2)-methyltransferase